MTRARTHLARRILVAVLLVAARGARGAALDVTTTTTEQITTEFVYAEGCNVCNDYRCPNDPNDCFLGTVPDSCGCCGERGVCARLDGEPCWNSSLAGELPAERRNEGLCARNYLCQLRTDLEPEDIPEAVCVCMEQSPACGSDGRTYPTPCALHEEASRQRGSSELRLAHLGPCPSRPRIYSAPEDIYAEEGHHVALSCEAKGFPLPDIFWEFRSADGRTVIRHPSDGSVGKESEVSTNEEPETSLRTSWLQLSRLGFENAGTYLCVASNTLGEASASAVVTVLQHG